jgi:DNA-binding LacI/PurR family transcriptional regulator
MVVPQTDSYFAPIIASARATFRGAGFSMAIGPTMWAREEEDQEIALMEQKGFDGIIASLSSSVSDEAHQILQFFLERKRAVSLNWKFDGIPSATIDHERCGYLAARHLIELGHESICFVGADYPTPDSEVGIPLVDARYRGFCFALGEAGIIPDSEESVEGFLGMTDRPTGAYCGRALWALDLLSACVDDGVRVPEDLSIVGHDNDREKSAVRPRISTIDVKPNEVGAEAARMLMALIDGKSPEDAVIQPELIVRDSTRRCNFESNED